MNIATFVAKRIALSREKSFGRFIIRLATAATTLSVMVMILSLALTNGFQFTVSQKIFAFWGHIRVQHYEPYKIASAEEAPIQKSDSVLETLVSHPDVASVSTYASKSAILKTPETIEGVLFKGLEKSYPFHRLDRFLTSGRWISYPDSGYSNEIVLSAYTAGQLKLKVGDAILIYFIQNDGSSPRARKLTLTGIYKTGIEEYDHYIAIGDLRLIQRLNGWKPDEIAGYEVFLKDFHQASRVNDELFDALPRQWASRDIREINPNLFDWLNLQDKTIALVLAIMTIVAVLNLVTCLIILTLERTRMIGVLKAVGAPNGVLQRIFLNYGSMIAITGIVAGNFLALLICWLQQRFGFIHLNEEMYYISKAEVRLEWWHFLLVDLGSFIVCYLILIIPTLIIRRIHPVRAIEFR